MTLGSKAVMELLEDLPAEMTIWKASAQLIGHAGFRTELARAISSLGIQPDDYMAWAAEQDGPDAERVTPTAVELALRKAAPAGFSTADLLPMLVLGREPFSGMAGAVSRTWGIEAADVAEACKAVRLLSEAALASAALGSPADWRVLDELPYGRAQLAMLVLPFPESSSSTTKALVEIPSSIGLAWVLGRADALRAEANLPAITSACLLRAMLPYWSTPATRRFLRGLGVGIHIGVPSWIRDWPEPGYGVIKLSASSEHFPMSEPAFKAMIVAGILRDIGQSAMTPERILLGLMSIRESCLSQLTQAAIGEHVNLPLLYLTGNSRVAVGPREAEFAINLGEKNPGIATTIEDLPPRVITGIERRVYPLSWTEADSWECAARATAAITAWRRSAEGARQNPEADYSASRATFVRTGHLQSLRDFVIDLPEEQFHEGLAAVRILRGKIPKPGKADLQELGITEKTGGTVPVLCTALGHPPTDGIARFGAKLTVLAAQDWCAADIEVARKLEFSPAELALGAADDQDYALAAASTVLDARIAMRHFRARQFLPSGVPGSGLAFAGEDIGHASGTLITLLLSSGRSCAVRAGRDATASCRPVPHSAITTWWQRYRKACLTGQQTAGLLAELAEMTGLTDVLPPSGPEGPLRLCVAGDYQGLPIGQALVVALNDHDVSVIAHLGGGPFADRFGTALAPSGRLSGRVAVVSPPAVSDVSPLPYAEAEAAAVARIHGARFQFAGIRADRARILRVMELSSGTERPLIWHFAAHGTIRPAATGELTAGILASDHEILGTLDIGQYAGANVLFCSACDIAAIPPVPHGVSWPFAALAGGTAFVIAAPQPVNDLLTLVTMLRLHEIWIRDRLPVWQALTHAQHWVDSSPIADVERMLTRNGISDSLMGHAIKFMTRQRATGVTGNQWAFLAYTL